MLTLAAIIALVSVPYVLDVYFTSPRSADSSKEERAKIDTAGE